MARNDNVVSGKYGCARVGVSGGVVGDADELYEITAWEYNEQTTDTTYASCETDGDRRRIDGSYDMTGTITLIYNAAQPFRSVVKPTDNVELFLFKRKAMPGVTGIYDHVPAKILGISGGVNIDQGGAEQFTISWGLNGTTDLPAPLFDQEQPALAT